MARSLRPARSSALLVLPHDSGDPSVVRSLSAVDRDFVPTSATAACSSLVPVTLRSVVGQAFVVRHSVLLPGLASHERPHRTATTFGCEILLLTLRTVFPRESLPRSLPIVALHPLHATLVGRFREPVASAASSLKPEDSEYCWTVPFFPPAPRHLAAFHAALHGGVSAPSGFLRVLSQSWPHAALIPVASDVRSPFADGEPALSNDSGPATDFAVALSSPVAAEPAARIRNDCVRYRVPAAAFAAETNCCLHRRLHHPAAVVVAAEPGTRPLSFSARFAQLFVPSA